MDNADNKNNPGDCLQENEIIMANDATKSIAFFDFDGTITSKDTLFEILKFTKGRFAFYTGFFILSPVLVAHKLKLVSSHKTKEIVLTYFLKGMDATLFDSLCRKFADTRLPDLLRSSALHEIRRHLKNKTKVVIVSASAENWILPWSKQFKIECIATKLETENGKLTGKIEGRNCNGEEKVISIQKKFNLTDYSKIYGYGDSGGDQQMLSISTESFYKPFRQKL